MPVDRSDLATPTLMRAARGTYARSIRAHLQAIGVEDLPRNGAFILFGLHESSGLREDLPAGLGVSKQAVSQAIDILVNRGYVERSPDAVRPPTDHLGVDRARAPGGGRRLARHRGDRQPARGQGVARRRGGHAVRVDGPGQHQGGGDGLWRGLPRRSRRTRQFRQFSPIFPVGDLAAALRHYAALGCKTFAYESGVDYGFANRDRLSIHLTLDPGHEPGSAYLDVRDADALYEEWTKPGVGGLTRPVEPMPYGIREGSHIDPDGNLIRFGSPEEDDAGLGDPG